ncbi:MAG: DNA polymerase III subunit chi [Sphingomonadales bacterium 32-68-7]|nr:MAG: DNA polymerase III subunit chi [Sphingomonadales bacterium 12-68-11]OYX09123.1 MAG: DNA polymerase III subunit chi [Sphingomonadales bacterium 32-68-7]
MRVDFYLLSRDPVEAALPRIARSVKAAGERLLVVSADAAQLSAVGKALWAQFPDEFLANGLAGEPHAERQPVLLGESCEAANGARHIALADGAWRDEALGFERAFLFVNEDSRGAARAAWKALGTREDVERHFWKQDGARWIEGP